VFVCVCVCCVSLASREGILFGVDNYSRVLFIGSILLLMGHWQDIFVVEVALRTSKYNNA